MKSSTGAYYVALDHVRAAAAFLVFVWHFAHWDDGFPVPFNAAPYLPLLDEGHTGVALFMTLSGYLFAKLLDGKQLRYGAFVRNRALRLLPLLAVVLFALGFQQWWNGRSLTEYAVNAAKGLVLPSLPSGAWSVTVEFHFYLLLPALLRLGRRSKYLPLLAIPVAMAGRGLVWFLTGEVQWAASMTLVGRIDQFVLGLFAFHVRDWFARRHRRFAAVFGAFVAFYAYFDATGGYARRPVCPSPSPLWIVLPTIEGVAYAVLIAWYDASFAPPATGVSRLLGRVGEYSYSIYLLHFFFVTHAAQFVHERVMDISRFPLALAWATAFFLLTVPVGYLSYRHLESPFLRYRRPYAAR